MDEKSGLKIFLEYVPSLKIRKKALGIYIYQFLIFIILLLFFWYVSSKFLLGALIAQLIITFCLTGPYIYFVSNISKIRDKYRKKYDNLAYEHFFYRLIIYIPPFGNASALIPFLLVTYDGLPRIIQLPNHIITNPFFPFYVSIPIGLLLLIFGIMLRRPSGGFDIDIQYLVYLIFPEKSRKIEGGIYEYVRHPQYAGEGFAILGIGILANNLMAMGVSLIHFLAYLLIIKVEDAELLKRFGEKFGEYKKKVPALFPKYGNWKKFLRYIFAKGE